MKRVWLAFALVLSFGLLSSCSAARVMMQTAPSEAKGAAATPSIKAANIADWELQKYSIRGSLEREIYGTMPRNFETHILSQTQLNAHPYSAHISELVLQTRPDAKTSPNEQSWQYNAVLLTPKSAAGPVPIIMMENFCPNHSVVPDAGVSRPPDMSFSCDEDGFMASLMTYFFGRYIATPPIEDILAAGYGLAVIFPSATFPDNAQRFEAIRQAAPDAEHPWGAVSAWAYQFSSLSHALGKLGFETTIAYGHSRYGKAALLAAAYDEDIDAVIAHQSGTGGASLSRHKKGETVADITSSYPHWFTPAYREDALTSDQHHMLALIAPRPLMLGNAKRDVWSDPEGAFRAAKGATPIYRLYGSDGLRQDRLTNFDSSADIAFWVRPGTHGVVKEDWPAFLSFLDSHF